MKEINDAFGNWLAGFTDGDGCFGIEKRKRDNPCAKYKCRFQIALRDDDKAILEEIRDTLGIGSISDKPVSPSCLPNTQPQSRFRVEAINDCAELVKLFTKYPLRAKKQRDFDIWKTMVGEMQKPIDERDAELLHYCFREIREIRKYEGRDEIPIPPIKRLQLTIEFADAVEDEGDRARRRVEGIVKNNKSAEKQQ